MLGKATRTQITRIHVGKSVLKLEEVQYRGLLSGYGVDSSKDLTYQDANKLIRQLKNLGWHETYKPRRIKEGEDKGYGRAKYHHLKDRDPELATPKQLRMIEGMWRQVSREKDDHSLTAFIKRITGVDNIEWISHHHVAQLLKAIKDIDKQNLKKAGDNVNGKP
ncbi:MAG: regulatory protein GemA [Bacteroidetes bacterium]|nr:regulatory protein GemA [Bacteroidota bacterium]